MDIKKSSLIRSIQKAQNLLLCSPAAGGPIWERLAGKKVLVAFSGGKDSLTLLAYMFDHQTSSRWQLAACHVNHHLRGEESLRDEVFCRQWCEKRGITFFCKEKTVTDAGRGMESAAREARYTLLIECAAEWAADYIVTAHTENDQIESFFVDLMTGVSVFTLGGVAPQNTVPDGTVFIRPMLDISTEMVQDYLCEKGLTAVYDSTNGDMRYIRNFVREKLLPAVDGHRGLKTSVLRIQEESRLLDDYFGRMTAHFVSMPEEGGVVISRACLDSAEPVFQRYILGKWVSMLARGGLVHVQAIFRQMAELRSARIDLPQDYLCEVTPRNVRLFHRSLVRPFEYTSQAYKGALPSLPQDVQEKAEVFRSRRSGDRYKGKKLKDLFERLKLDPYERDRALVVEAGGYIIWVEHIDE